MRKQTFALFDADGTLLDSMPYHRALAAECMVEYFEETGIDYKKALAEYDRTIGVPFLMQMEAIFPEATAIQRILCTEAYNRRKREEVYGKAKSFSDVNGGVLEIIGAGIVPSVSTSNERDAVAGALEREGILGYFEAVRGLEDGSKSEHIEIVRKRYNPEEIFFIGDTPHDMSMSEFGVITIGRNGDRDGEYSREALMDAGASFVTNNFKDLLTLMSK